MPCLCTGSGGDAVVSPPPAALVTGANLSALNDRISDLADECRALRIETKRGAYDKLVKKMTLCVKIGELELKCLRSQIEIAAKQDTVIALTSAEATARQIYEGDGKEYDGGKN